MRDRLTRFAPKKIGILFLTALLTAIGMTGCESIGIREETQKSIKALYYDEAAFFTNYGSLFAARYPNIDVKVVSTAGVRQDQMDAFIEEQKPDVVILDDSQYEQYAQDGRLRDLEPFIKKDKFPLAGIAPAVIDTIRTRGAGKLYGLASRFSSRALYYNRTLFDQAGIPYPRDQMSWEEVLQLAQRFPAGDKDSQNRIAGLVLNPYDVHPYSSGLEIGYGQGLAYYSSETLNMTIDTPEWKKVFQLTFAAMRSGAIYQPSGPSFTPGASQQENFAQNPFIGGKAAMTISGNDFANELKRAAIYLKERMPVWDIVTVPIDPANPDDGDALWIQDIIAIATDAANVQDAWTFVKYVNGDEFARATAKASVNGQLPSRTAYLKDDEGHHLEAFSVLKPHPNPPKGTSPMPQTFYSSFEALAKEEIAAAYEGRKTIDEALQNLQQQGQVLLRQLDSEIER